MKSSKILYYFLIGMVIVLCALPFANIAFVTLKRITFSGQPLEQSFRFFKYASTLSAFKNTFLVSFYVGLLSSIFAIPMSLLIMRTDLKHKSKWRTTLLLPYLVPPYIGAIAWVFLANPTNGVLNGMFETSWLNIYTFIGLVWVESAFLYTFLLLSLLNALEAMDPSLEESARVCGANWFQVFRHITFPIIFPSFMGGFLFVLLSSWASFGVPALIGNPGGIYLITTKIYSLTKMGTINGMFQSWTLSLILLFLAFLVILANNFILRNKKYSLLSGKSVIPTVYKLGKWQKPAQLILFIFILIIFLMPLSAILISALSKVQGVLTWENMGLQNIKKLFFEIDEFYRSLKNSFFLAFCTAMIAMVVSLIINFYHKFFSKKSFVTSLPILSFTVPSTVLAIAMLLLFYNLSSFFKTNLHMGYLIFIACYLSKYFHLAMKTSMDSVNQVHISLFEAGQVCGASFFSIFRLIAFPMLKASAMASVFLVFMPALSELTMSILITGPNMETLGTLLFQLQEYGDASGGGAAVLSLFIIVFILILNFTLKKLSNGKYGF
ncbi:iron ABC transporter permease [Bacteriovoracaceae bacterium]|nr:iron ABC transporter permease [Bacteriovoracaceae bacterium]